MKLIVRRSASENIAKTGEWVERKNTSESGARWVRRVYETLEDKARMGVKHAICRNKRLAELELRCFTYNDKWIIAYQIESDKFIVRRFIWGAKLQ